jgi:hypothetical protein
LTGEGVKSACEVIEAAVWTLVFAPGAFDDGADAGGVVAINHKAL